MQLRQRLPTDPVVGVGVRGSQGLYRIALNRGKGLHLVFLNPFILSDEIKCTGVYRSEKDEVLKLY